VSCWTDISQRFFLISALSVIENVMLPMRIAGKLSKEEMYERAISLLTAVNLKQKLYERVTNLSGGEQQRVAIARALANDPPLILADEPTGNLDTENAKSILQLFDKINKERGKTIIVVTHDPRVAAFASKVFYITDGELRSTVW